MDSATYSASSRLQAAGLQPALTLFEEAARTVPLPRAPQPIAIADYGAANGYNSLLPIGAAIAIVRERTRPDHAILVAHTDVADNDFTALFSTLTEDPDSYLKKDAATFASAVGRSFYTQILPSDSIVLGWSSWAVHWLSRIPMPIPDHVQISYSSDAAACKAYGRQAAEDWHEFVAFRGRELAPGGRLVVLTVGLEPDGGSGFRAAFDAIVTTLPALVDDGLVTAEEARRMSIPRWAATRRTSGRRSPRPDGSKASPSSTWRCSTPKTGSGRSTGSTAMRRRSARIGLRSFVLRSSRHLPGHSTAASTTRAPSSSSNGSRPQSQRTSPPHPSR
jgi:hypothetical protein